MNIVKFNDSRTAVNMPVAVRFLKVFTNYKLLEDIMKCLVLPRENKVYKGILAFPLG